MTKTKLSIVPYWAQPYGLALALTLLYQTTLKKLGRLKHSSLFAPSTVMKKKVRKAPYCAQKYG
jgi:hypothetical protein